MAPDSGGVPSPALERRPDGWRGTFTALGSPCELLVDVDDRDEATVLAAAVAGEAARIERKWSRYRDDGIIPAINRGEGRAVVVDDETAGLLDLAADCFALSGGRFDATSGALRRAWRFDGTGEVPTREAVAALLPLVGWGRVSWRRPEITLPAGMELDFGGLGKEYAVDRAAQLLSLRTRAAALVNFGGDLRALGSRRDGRPWRVGVEAPSARADEAPRPGLDLELAQGALATSGDSRRCLVRDGVRYGHILDARTGWPAPGAPRSVTVLADTCLEAGVLATLAMLQGAGAREFLAAQATRHWVQD